LFCFVFEIGSWNVAQAGLELTILPPWCPECCDFGCTAAALPGLSPFLPGSIHTRHSNISAIAVRVQRKESMLLMQRLSFHDRLVILPKVHLFAYDDIGHRQHRQHFPCPLWKNLTHGTFDSPRGLW
jgi:hypothetical protein